MQIHLVHSPGSARLKRIQAKSPFVPAAETKQMFKVPKENYISNFPTCRVAVDAECMLCAHPFINS